MKIAFTIAPGRGDTDLLLAGLADRLAAAGVVTCGTVQINSECGGRGPCDMDVRVLPDGPLIRISQSLGPEARGCRLDAGALETATGLSEARLDGADFVIVNKFGKQEAQGRGFRTLIAEALAADIPVLVGLNGMNREAFDAFTGGLAAELSPEMEALLAWAEAALGRDRDAA
jgi:glycosyltransferase involved in cell wall biosynthesis